MLNRATLSRESTVDRYTPPVGDGREPGARAGSREFEEWIGTYVRLIRAAVRKVAGAEADRLGQDVEQRLLTDLWKRHRKDDAIEHPTTYIYRAAVRETVRALKSDSRRRETPLDLDPPSPRTDNPHSSLRRKELARAIEEEVEALRPERSKAVRFHLAGFTVDEIMTLQSWSYNKSRNLIARGMADLRRRLTMRGFQDG